MSSLEQQLKQIGTADLRNVTETSRKYRASFLFDAREAADQDLEAIYSIGLNGIMELRILDPTFSAFEITLFSENMKSVDRVLLSKEENDKLDASIAAFLTQLSPYFLLKPAGKAIEWLIRRFRINEFNIDSVIACILPYHETKAFVTMVSTLNIESNSPWLFLKPVKTSRATFERDLLVKKMKADKYILRFICDLTANAVDEHVSFKTLFSFYAATLIAYIKREDALDENVMLTLMPHLLKGVRASKVPEYQIATYMILSQLAVKVQFGAEALMELLGEMTTYYNSKFFEHYLLATVHLAQVQENFTSFPEKSYNALAIAKNFDQALLGICSKYSADAYIRPLLFNLIESAFKHRDRVDLLSSLLNNDFHTKETIVFVCNKMMDEYLKYVNDDGDTKAFVETVSPALQTLSQRHFEALDSALNTRFKQLSQKKTESSKEAANHLYKFSNLAFHGTGHEVIKETNTTLYLSLQSPSATIRLLAVKKLVSISDDEVNSLKQSEDTIESALMSCLIDDMTLLSYVFDDIPSFLIKHVQPSKILTTIKAILGNHQVLHKVSRKIMKFLIGPLLNAAPSLREDILRIVLANTLSSIRHLSSEHSIFHLVSGSSLGQDPLLLGFGDIKEKIKGQNVKDTKLQIKITSELVNLLANNMQKHRSEDNVRFWLGMVDSDLVDERAIAILVVNKCITKLNHLPQYNLAVSFGEALKKNELSLKSASINSVIVEDLVSETNGEPSKRLVQDVITAKKANTVTQLELQIFSFINIITSLSVPKEKIHWWYTSKSSASKADAEVEEYKQTVSLLFSILVTSPAVTLYRLAMEKLVSIHLKNSLLEFLPRVWTENDTVSSPVVKGRALQLASMYLAAHAKDKVDYQTIVPSLLILLSHESNTVRKEAVECWGRLYNVYENLGAIGNDKFYQKAAATKTKTKPSAVIYGSSMTQACKLSHSDAGHFVDHLWYKRRELAEDANYVSVALNEYLDACLTAKKKTKMNRILDYLLSSIDHYPTIYGQTSLLKELNLVQSRKKISSLLDLLERTLTRSITKESTELIAELILCFTPEFAPELGQAKNDKSLKLFCSLLKNEYNMQVDSDDDVWEISTRRMALQQITAEFFSATPATAQEAMFAIMVDIATDSDQRDIKAVKSVIRDIDIDVTLIEPFLQRTAQKINDFSRPSDTVHGKKSRKESPPSKETVESDLFVLVTILEILEYKTINNGVHLAKSLFDVLSALLSANLSDSPVSLEYVNQLILTALTKIVQSMEEHNIQPVASQLQVHLVVQCIRSTNNPQTHNSALLLMAAIASLDAESVLHNIMPVFTFMGANVLRQDDNYSFQVIQQTLKKILPALVASSRSRKQSEASLVLEVKPILKVFVDALSHIPEHRQLHLFKTLVDTLGEQEFLYAIISLVLERYLERSNKGSSEAESVKEFSLAISHEFSVPTQLHSLILLMNSLLALPNDKPQDIEMATTAVFNVNERSAKQLRQFKRACLQFAYELLGSRPFLEKVVNTTHSDPDAESILQKQYTKAAESVLQIIQYFSQYLSQYSASSNATPGIIKSWKESLKVAYKTLDRINLLLPVPAFVDTIGHLIKHQDVVIRRKAMELFKSRVEEMSSKALKIHHHELVDIVPQFATIVDSDITNDDAAIVSKQTALDCITVLARHFGSSRPEIFAGVLPIIIGDNALNSGNSKVQIPSLVCLTFICNETGTRAIPSLPKFMPIVLNMLEATTEDQSPDVLLQLSAITSLETIIHTMPHFISPYVQRLLALALHSTIQSYDETSDEKQQLTRQKANALLNEMATNVAPRVLLTPVFAYLDEAIKNGKESLLSLLDLVDAAIKSMSREDITANYKQIFKFFLSVFDFRRLHQSEFSEESVSEVEDRSVQAFINLVMKLNETLFKPVFLKTLDWATIELAPEGSESLDADQECRALFFYKLLDGLLEKLKSIFTPYYGYVIDYTIKCLTLYTDGDKTPDTLWNYVMVTLRKSFLYDSDNLWNTDKFEKILQPVLNQMLVTSAGDSEDYLARMITYQVPLVGQIAVTVSNDALWKPLNHGVLMKTREDDPEIRLAALRCLEELYTRLGEEWLLFLAESISFLAELMEDDDARVEKLVHQVNAQIETYLGESLDKYFN